MCRIEKRLREVQASFSYMSVVDQEIIEVSATGWSLLSALHYRLKLAYLLVKEIEDNMLIIQ